MAKRKGDKKDVFGIPYYQMESLARVLLPAIQAYLSSNEGKRDYEKWIDEKKTIKIQSPEKSNNTPA